VILIRSPALQLGGFGFEIGSNFREFLLNRVIPGFVTSLRKLPEVGRLFSQR
jgi:hypothetical protein